MVGHHAERTLAYLHLTFAVAHKLYFLPKAVHVDLLFQASDHALEI